MRPVSIIRFEQLYGAGVACGLIAGLLSWQVLNGTLAGRVPPGLLLFGVLLGVAVPLLLLWLVARRASDVARWIAVLFAALGITAVLWAVARGHYALAGPVGLLDLARLALEIAGLAFTFRPDARRWLERRGMGL